MLELLVTDHAREGAVMTDHVRTQIQALRDEWIAKADELSAFVLRNGGLPTQPATAYSDGKIRALRTCADRLDTLLASLEGDDRQVGDVATSVTFPDHVSMKMLENTVAVLQQRLDACAPYLKDGETPAQCIARNRADVDLALRLLAAEKRKTEAPSAGDRSSSPRAAGAQDEIQAVITEAEGLLKEITPGEWFVEHVVMSDSSDIYSRHPGGYTATIANVTGFRDDTFIAAAPRLVRQLVAALRASLPAAPDPEDR